MSFSNFAQLRSIFWRRMVAAYCLAVLFPDVLGEMGDLERGGRFWARWEMLGEMEDMGEMGDVGRRWEMWGEM